MTSAEADILARMLRQPDAWLRPMDFGGTRCSHHGNTTKRMARKGWVERERRDAAISTGAAFYRGSFRYRATEAGRRAYENHIALQRLVRRQDSHESASVDAA